ncbi:unnamed protein product [Nesidiocoris tenuis]|uniref:Vacuolar protein sorting-associated protein 13 VPS13 adaptor binding domain-containing protein n=1 Tax=Nesidiocoris tenuis TaxID=355587 RepID=A0A6H5FYQ2_9HEMI|nr:unnamed protein product [Nesidiocoris tenuis]
MLTNSALRIVEITTTIVDDDEKPLLFFRLHSLGVTVTKDTFDQHILAELGGVSLRHSFQGKEIPVFNSLTFSDKEYLFSIEFIMDFLDNFQVAQEKLVEASQAAAEVAKLNVQEAYTNAAKAELSLDLKIHINRKNYLLLLKMLDENIGATANQKDTVSIKTPHGQAKAVRGNESNITNTVSAVSRNVTRDIIDEEESGYPIDFGEIDAPRPILEGLPTERRFHPNVNTSRRFGTGRFAGRPRQQNQLLHVAQRDGGNVIERNDGGAGEERFGRCLPKNGHHHFRPMWSANYLWRCPTTTANWPFGNPFSNLSNLRTPRDERFSPLGNCFCNADSPVTVTQNPSYSHRFQDFMHLTVTKTCLDVLTALGASFQEAYYHPTEFEGEKPTFELHNDTGYNVTVHLASSPFKPWGIEDPEGFDQVQLSSGGVLELQELKTAEKNKKETQDEFLNISASGEMEQIYYESSMRHTMASQSYNIYIRPTVIFKNLLPVDVICNIQGMLTEPVVEKGESIQVLTAEPGSSTIVVRIPDYLNREWVCKHLIEDEGPELAVWTFETYESPQKFTLELGVHTLKKNETVIMELYCPFWMLNKTGLLLSYKIGISIQLSYSTLTKMVVFTPFYVVMNNWPIDLEFQEQPAHPTPSDPWFKASVSTTCRMRHWQNKIC